MDKTSSVLVDCKVSSVGIAFFGVLKWCWLGSSMGVAWAFTFKFFGLFVFLLLSTIGIKQEYAVPLCR